MPREAPLLAVLIDADNVSAKHAEAIFVEIATLGEASVRRIYGDFSNKHLKGWADTLSSFAIVPHQQFANTIGKNSSDISLVIDAMDLLHSGRFDGFVLVSSDSDFTRLASRIREHGLDVYGIGAQKTPEAFRKACKRFIFLENLGSEPGESKATPIKSSKQSPDKAVALIEEAMRGIDIDDDWYPLDRIGQRLVANHPDFDPRTFGAAKLGNLIESTGAFEVDRNSRPLRIRIAGQGAEKTGPATRQRRKSGRK